MENGNVGVILKGIGGFYYVSAPSGIYECKARGVFRKRNITPLVGDRVVLENENTDKMTAVLYDILPRKNQLIRPAVSNADVLAAVIAAENPKPNLYLLDKLISSAEAVGMDIVICINKIDLSDARPYTDIYKSSGFDVVELSAAEERNIDILRTRLRDKISVFAGNSGVGKSSIINLLLEEEVFDTGEVSKRVERGRHTTRHSELRSLPFGGYIIDTPGFGSLDTEGTSAEKIADTFRELKEFGGSCRFADCRHLCELGCSVIDAVKAGKIQSSRYESYCLMVKEAEAKKKR